MSLTFNAELNAWGEISGGKFTPRWTPEEHQFREEALAKILSGTMTQPEIHDLQRECVRRAQLSPYSWARK